MYDRPDPVEQLAAVAEFLRDQVMPRVDGQLAFHVRVAANMLDTVSRQTRLAPEAEAAELARLRNLLGSGDNKATLDDLNRELCERIALGRFDIDTPGLCDHLWRVTLDKLAVDQPRYDTLLRLLAAAKTKEA
jgi:hypothetical protein